MDANRRLLDIRCSLNQRIFQMEMGSLIPISGGLAFIRG
jgi:hypothetical protein